MSSISVHAGDTLDVFHDNRESDIHQNQDINISQSHLNEIDKKYKNLKVAYDDIFGEATREYNKKQKHKNRKIDNYLKKVKSTKVGFEANKHDQVPARQLILAIGKAPENPDDPENKEPQLHILDTNPKEAEFRRKVLREYVNGFQDRNPNMVVVNNAIHMDEPNVHSHLTIVPYYHSKTGLSKKFGFNNAIKETIARNRGVDTKDVKDGSRKLFTEWVENERSEIAKIAKIINPDFELERVGSHGNMSPSDYKKFKKEENELKKSQIQQIKNLDPGATIQSKYDKNKTLSINEKAGYAAFFSKSPNFLNKEVEKAKKVQEKRLQELEGREVANSYQKDINEADKLSLNLEKNKLNIQKQEFESKYENYEKEHEKTKSFYKIAKKEKCEMIKSLEPRLKISFQNNKPEQVGKNLKENKEAGITVSEEIQTEQGFKTFMNLDMNKLNKCYSNAKKSNNLKKERKKKQEYCDKIKEIEPKAVIKYDQDNKAIDVDDEKTKTQSQSEPIENEAGLKAFMSQSLDYLKKYTKDIWKKQVEFLQGLLEKTEKRFSMTTDDYDKKKREFNQKNPKLSGSEQLKADIRDTNARHKEERRKRNGRGMKR